MNTIRNIQSLREIESITNHLELTIRINLQHHFQGFN